MIKNPTTSSPGVSALEEKNRGRIFQIIGLVHGVTFPPRKMPNIYNALVIKGQDTVGQEINVTCEVQQLIGNNRLRAVAMSATNGLLRGIYVIDTGAPLSVPVGGATLRRIFNVLGEPVHNLGPTDTRTSIYRSAFSLFKYQIVSLKRCRSSPLTQGVARLIRTWKRGL